MLGCPVDLKYIAGKMSNVVYNPKKMSCLTMKHRKIGRGRCAAVLFRTGYLSVNGSQTVMEARRNFRQFARRIQRLGYPVTLCKIDIQCISAVARVPKFLKPNMKHAVKRLGASYEPEISNSACIKRSGVCILLFASGGIVLTGIKLGRGHRKVVRKLIRSIVYNCKRS